MEKDKEKKACEKAEKIRLEKLAGFIGSEYERRRNERVKLEAEWKLNAKYYEGEQYCDVTENGDVEERDADYFWQPRRVYNHIAPITESKLAKLSRVRPIINVKAMGDDAEDFASSSIAENVLNSAYERLDLNSVIMTVTEYSEIFGTGFYKIVWDNDGGEKISDDGQEQDVPKFGDVSVSAVMPFEIFPDSIYHEELADCKSIIHASVMDVGDIKSVYGVEVLPQENVLPIFAKGGAFHERNSATVLEYYERPTENYKDGRMVTVCGNVVLYEGTLPFINGDDQTRDFPFVKQVSIREVGKFFGASAIKRLIPIQRAYNAVKNRKQEFLNRLSMGVMTVEDGSVDTEDLELNGLQPGRVLIYRQGANKPEMMKETSMSTEFREEEERLLTEFNTVSGVNDLSIAGLTSTSSSGKALEIVFAQDNERISVQVENIRKALLVLYKQILRLYKEFAVFRRKIEVKGKKGISVISFSGDEIVTDKVQFSTENEMLFTPTQKKAMLFELYSSGILQKDGSLSETTRSKLLELLGYGDLDDSKSMRELHVDKANKENTKMEKEEVEVDIIDNHEMHIDTHTAYFLAEYERIADNKQLKERLEKHILKHKNFLRQDNGKTVLDK